MNKKKIPTNGSIHITTDRSKMDIDLIYNFLTNAYWSTGKPKWVVKKSIKNSLCFGVFYKNQQVGFARVITDYVTFAYIADLFILEEFRGKGISKLLIKHILEYKKLIKMKKWILATKDAHALYEKFGFEVVKDSKKYMELISENAYDIPVK